MFSQASVILFMGVADTPWAETPHPLAEPPPWTDPPEQTPLWADTSRKTAPWTDTPWADTPLGRHPYPPRAKTATAADGTHPTGMHSCCFWFGTLQQRRVHRHCRDATFEVSSKFLSIDIKSRKVKRNQICTK